MSEEQEGSAREVDYERFCTYPAKEALGSEVQGQFFYLVQPYKISVYEYYSESKKPQLIEELIYNKLILHYAINEHYICILTSSFLDIRDRNNWNKLIYTHPTPETITQPSILLDQHLLYLSTPDDQLSFETIDIREKEILYRVRLGRGEKNHLLAKQPILLRKMGNLEDFYLWSKDLQSVEMGMLYKQAPGCKNKFELSLIELKNAKIHSIFYHKINSHELAKKSSEYLIVVAQNTDKGTISVWLYEINPKELQTETEVESLDSVVQQIEYLGNFNRSAKNTSLVKEVLEEAFDDSCQEEDTPKKFQLVLQNMKGYESSFYHNDKLWILSPTTICCIELYSDATLEDIIKERDSKERLVIKSIDYSSKTEDKIGVGVYQNNLLFKENTVSYMIGYQKEYTESIAEEIMEDQELEEILLGKKKEEEPPITSMYQNTIDPTLEQKEQQHHSEEKDVPCLPPGLFSYKSHYTHRHDKKSIHSKVYSETHHQLRAGTAQFGIQTDDISHRIDDFQEVELLVAKYTSAVSVSCSKVKQSQLQKDKFDKEIKSIVDTMAKTVIEPFLEERFVSFLDAQVKRISCGITTILLQELETLNETMKKIEIKENHMRGKKIYDFSKQIENIKTSVSGVFDALKERELSKIASNQLILEEARVLKDTAQNIEKQIIQISAKNESSEGEINEQIKEIMNLVTQMCNREEDSEGEAEESDEQSSQGEKKMRESEGESSQDEHSSQDKEQPRMPGYQHFPPFVGKGHPEKTKFDNRRYPQGGYYPEYVPAPPPQFPFYYPYGPHSATLPYQSLYGPLPIHPTQDPYSGSVTKKEKKKKK